MKVYKLGYHTCEESHYIEVKHSKKFTQKELEDIFADILKNTLNKIGVQYNFSFQHLIDSNAFYEELENRGFKEVMYEQVLSVFGWARVVEKDWDIYTTDLEKRLREKINKNKKLDR